MSQNPSQSSHFKNHLIFYVVAVTTVLGLFQLTSAYGETHLQAPPNLNGRYLSTSAPPGCPTDRRLAITIQQSGIYLNGAAELAQATEKAPTEPIQPEQLTLIGHWRQQQVKLAGYSPALSGCSPANSTVNLAASFQPPASSPATEAALVGQLNLSNTQPWSFTAVQQAAITRQSDH